MTVDLLERLERARVASDTLSTLQAEAAELPALERELAAVTRQQRAEQVATMTEQQAAAVVDQARADLADWRAEYREWVSSGWRLVGRLRTIQSKLLPALDAAIAAAVGLERSRTFEPGAMTEAVPGFVGDGAVDGVLARLGVSDLEPFPPSGNDWTEQVKAVVVQHAGRLFLPALGRVQFKRGVNSRLRSGVR